MYRFTNDYSEACHPAILSAIAQSNLEGNFGYSTDSHCENAKALVKQACGDGGCGGGGGDDGGGGGGGGG